MLNVLTGQYKSKQEAHFTVQDLLSAGILPKRIEVTTHGTSGSHTFSPEVIGNKAFQGVIFGFLVGAFGCGVVGTIWGAATLFNPWPGVTIVGPLPCSIIGTITGAALGSVVGGLIGLTKRKERPDAFQDTTLSGSVIVGVHVDDYGIETVEKVLNRYGHSDSGHH